MQAQGANMNIPLMPGGGSAVYHSVFDQLILPKLQQFRPDIILVACGFDASGVDPLSRMLLEAKDFAAMTDRLMSVAGGRLVLMHEGGYSEAHVPFCGHAVLETLSRSSVTAPDPLSARITGQQPCDAFNQLEETRLAEIAALHQM